MKRSMGLPIATALVAAAVIYGFPFLGGSDACAYPTITTWGQVKHLFGCGSTVWPVIFAAVAAILRG